ncbi:hypothetical protein OIU85_018688 [Salix viminalis]|uniref:Protein kinase domain-containing protein n=1 Tax=Salix viminalis TaxID=40686 RepID=A0A9Q0ZJ94_SALVM|nr:hypothetical protein OIU85_018688 [Salix viminalis]
MNLIYLEDYFNITTNWADSLPLNLPLNLISLPPHSFTTSSKFRGSRGTKTALTFRVSVFLSLQSRRGAKERNLFVSSLRVMRMRCLSCLNPHRNDIKIDIEHDPRSISRCSHGPSEHGKNQSPEDGARSFTFRELAAATRNFKEDNLIGEGGFGRVYKGQLETGELVAVKQLNQDGLQGNREFIVEVLMLSLLHHSNLVTLVGYCTSGDQRLLVYEYMPMGSLEDHLFELEPEAQFIFPNSWFCGSRLFLKDQKKYHQLADPLLEGCYPRRCLNYAIAITAMCLNEQANFRPLIGDILAALEYLAAQCHVSESNTGRARGTDPSSPYSDRKVVSRERDSRSRASV